jgi:hypothetical protein
MVDNVQNCDSCTDIEDYKLFRCHVLFVQNWCLDNVMKLNIGRTNIIKFSFRLCKHSWHVPSELRNLELYYIISFADIMLITFFLEDLKMLGLFRTLHSPF